MLDRYVAQVRLLLSVLPDIATETVFALKGGTAINLFCRDMPRLSVDVDLTYLPVGDRRSSREEIDRAFNRIATAITERNPRVKARRIAGGGDNDTRIMVSDGSAQIEIETSPVTRGAVYRHPQRKVIPLPLRIGDRHNRFAAMRAVFDGCYASSSEWMKTVMNRNRLFCTMGFVGGSTRPRATRIWREIP